jgi:hypothetical protein
MTSQSVQNSAFSWLSSSLFVVVFILLTVGDFATTLIALASGHAVELNPNADSGAGGIRVGFLIFANLLLMIPLTAAFTLGVTRAHQVPSSVLTHWWRYIADVYFVSPLNEGARHRRPLRLVSAAMTLLVLKIVILASNTLVVLGYHNPTSLLAKLWTHAGLTGSPRYWAAYAVMIVPCYVAAVGLAAIILRVAKQCLGGTSAIVDQ